MEVFVQQLINGITLGSIYGLIAIGYTMVFGIIGMAPSSVIAINVALHKKLPYDPAADFVPLALVAATPFVLVVTPSLPTQSVTELIALAKASPGRLAFASAGLGTPHHLFAEMFKGSAGIELTHAVVFVRHLRRIDLKDEAGVDDGAVLLTHRFS